MWLSRWGEVSLQLGHYGRWEGHTQPWKKANLLMEFDHAKLVEIPLEHQMPHYNIFTEVPAIPRKSLIPFSEYDFFSVILSKARFAGCILICIYILLCLCNESSRQLKAGRWVLLFLLERNLRGIKVYFDRTKQLIIFCF